MKKLFLFNALFVFCLVGCREKKSSYEAGSIDSLLTFQIDSGTYKALDFSGQSGVGIIATIEPAFYDNVSVINGRHWIKAIRKDTVPKGRETTFGSTKTIVASGTQKQKCYGIFDTIPKITKGITDTSGELEWGGNLVTKAASLTASHYYAIYLSSYGDVTSRDSTGKWTLGKDPAAALEILYQEYLRVVKEKGSIISLIKKYKNK